MSTTSPAIVRLDTFASQAVFRTLLETLSRPGTLGRLDAPWGAAIVPMSLADVETTIAVDGDVDKADALAMATGAAPVPLDEADLVACCAPISPSTIARLRRGTPLAPEKGAKVGMDCVALHYGAGDVTLTLRGPGVDGTTVLGVDGVAREVFDALGAAGSAPPAGIDAWLVDERGVVAGLPRTCRMEVY